VVDFTWLVAAEYREGMFDSQASGPSPINSPPVAPSPELVNRRMKEWWQAMELSHAMLLAGLRARIGPQGDLNQAYRDWYSEHQERKRLELEAVQEARRDARLPKDRS
jgi:hypothetical protein